MTINRPVSTLIVGVVLLSLATIVSAGKPDGKGKGLDCEPGDPRPKCAFDLPADGLTFKVEMDGAFVMNQFTTSDGSELLGDIDFTIDRPGFVPDPAPGMFIACLGINDQVEREACETWGTVFNVCNIYNINGTDPYGPDQFTTTPDRKGKVQWAVTRSGGGVRVWFFTSIQSPIDPLNPLEVVLQLTSKCAYHADQLDDFPDRTLCDRPFLPEGTGNQTTFDMQHFSNSAWGEKGIVQAQPCRVGEGELLPLHSNLTITAQ